MLPALSDDGDGLAVVLRDDAEQWWVAVGLKAHTFTKAELEHRRMRAHVSQKLQPSNDPVVQGYQFILGEPVYVNHAAPRYWLRLRKSVPCEPSGPAFRTCNAPGGESSRVHQTTPRSAAGEASPRPTLLLDFAS